MGGLRASTVHAAGATSTRLSEMGKNPGRAVEGRRGKNNVAQEGALSSDQCSFDKGLMHPVVGLIHVNSELCTNGVKGVSSKIIRVLSEMTHLKHEKTSSFCKKQPRGLTCPVKVFTLRSSSSGRFLGGGHKSCSFLASTFVPNGPHCCWLLDRQTDPLVFADQRVFCFQGYEVMTGWGMTKLE